MCPMAAHEGLNTGTGLPGQPAPASPGAWGEVEGREGKAGRPAACLSYGRRTRPWGDKTCPLSEDGTSRSHGELDSTSPSETQQNTEGHGRSEVPGLDGRPQPRSLATLVLGAWGAPRKLTAPREPAVAVTRPRSRVGEDRGCGELSPGGKVRREAPGGDEVEVQKNCGEAGEGPGPRAPRSTPQLGEGTRRRTDEAETRLIRGFPAYASAQCVADTVQSRDACFKDTVTSLSYVWKCKCNRV